MLCRLPVLDAPGCQTVFQAAATLQNNSLPDRRTLCLPPAPQAIAAVLSDGGLALLECVEEDLWEETLEEQLEAQPWEG